MFNVGRGEIYINVSFWNSVERICNLTKVNWGGGDLYMCINNTIFVHTEEKKGTLPRAES